MYSRANETTDIPTFDNESSFLAQVIENKTPMEVFLINGVCLKGRILSYDDRSILLESREGKKQLLYKHYISTVCIEKKRRSSNSDFSFYPMSSKE